MTLPDAEILFAHLLEQLRPAITPRTALVGIHTGGVWLAKRLHEALAIPEPLGTLDASFYRDDLGSRGLTPSPRRSHIPFEVEGAEIIIVDDVLYTGRTTRAVLNELFDYGRPARVMLAVLVDRGGRELPIEAQFCAYRLASPLPANQMLQLETIDDGVLSLRLIEAK
ncbi:MAG: hypothetical protein RIR70_1190 [Pseudomonadota bacterium]|jgi:pyrimidine operon attenuation protein/uracil phosphoribosyltransferase